MSAINPQVKSGSFDDYLSRGILTKIAFEVHMRQKAVEAGKDPDDGAADNIAFISARSAQETKRIYCPLCDAYYAEHELILWTGDDRLHHLCPGCDSDLLPSTSSPEVNP